MFQPKSRFFRKHPWIRRLVLYPFLAGSGFLVLIFVILCGRSWGPDRGYRVDAFKGPQEGSGNGPLWVGVAQRDITPDLSQYDRFVDVDGDNKYNPAKGDYFEDTNGNGRVDAVWLAGFGNNRPAQGVHDPLWARAIAFENHGVRVVLVTVDSIGMFYEKTLEIRKLLDPGLKIDHLMVSTTHNHQAPDTMGIWSVGLEKPHFRFDYAYMNLVVRSVADAAMDAVRNMEPAEAVLAETEVGPEGFVNDSRLPHVYDNVIRCARFVRLGSDETIGTLLVWGCHPETLGGSNPWITSDFIHFWREGVEHGLSEPNGAQGLGGMCLFFQGQLGGLMTQLHTTVPDRQTDEQYREASFEKARALGENLALATLREIQGPSAWRARDNRVAFCARTVFVPVKPLFALGVILGVVHPGFYWGKVKTEVNAFRVGEIEILTIPGEIYPEICEGGVEAPEGRDFPIQPVEVPPLRSLMRGRLNMIMGMANDELGYIIPKSQWDTKEPYAYGRDKPQYGEFNSFGPDVAPTLHAASMDVLRELHERSGI